MIVHDDASTDDTAEIISELATKYSNIRPILQKENQYSKGVAISAKILYPMARGKYIALCEGDDYWTDPMKLQKQVDYMESHPDCGLCFHDATIVNNFGKCIQKSFFPKNEFFKKYYKKGNCIYTAGEVVLLDVTPTNSMMCRTIDALDMPNYYYNNINICGDLSFRLYFSTKQYAYYMDEAMSVYRRGVSGSATQRANVNQEEKLKVLLGHLKILNEFDSETNFKYHKEVVETKRLKLFCHYFIEGAVRTCKNNEFRDIYKNMRLRKKFKFYLSIFMPKFYVFLKNLQFKIGRVF